MNAHAIRAYGTLAKPRITMMVCITTVLGFVLGFGEAWSLETALLLTLTLAGTAAASGGASALNQFVERDADARMVRTRNRPLPHGDLRPEYAVLFGCVLLFGGSIVLYTLVNPLTGYLALTSGALYVLVYTPLKRHSWLNTYVGAIPGAIPPMIGWAAATGTLGLGAWLLFLILFLWQHPHFFAIAWMFREDYERGGFKMLPNVYPDGAATFRQSLIFAAVLLPVSLIPTLIAMSGWLYYAGALLLGVWFLWVCVRWWATGTDYDARRVLRASVLYLPALLGLILVDAAVL